MEDNRNMSGRKQYFNFEEKADEEIQKVLNSGKVKISAIVDVFEERVLNDAYECNAVYETWIIRTVVFVNI